MAEHDDDSMTPLSSAFVDFQALINAPDFQARLDADEQDREAALVRREQRRRRESVLASGISIPAEDVETIALGQLRDTKALKAVQWWLRRATSRPTDGRPSTRFLGLLGRRGIGKTLACAWAVAEIGNALAVSADELGRALLAFKRDTTAERILRARLLVVDDVGTESAKDFQTALYELVNKRAASAYALTLFSSNLNKAEFAAKYDPRIVERILARGFLGDIGGDNLRQPVPAPGDQVPLLGPKADTP